MPCVEFCFRTASGLRTTVDYKSFNALEALISVTDITNFFERKENNIYIYVCVCVCLDVDVCL